MTRNKGKDKGGNTNLAAEFYVASQLFRLGYNVTVTLGHTKEIDLLVTHPDGRMISVDVKGTTWKTSWPLKLKRKRKDHFFVLVYYGVFEDPNDSPEIFVVPARQIKRLVEDWVIPGVPYRKMKNSRYENAWHLLFGKSRQRGKASSKGKGKEG